MRTASRWVLVAAVAFSVAGMAIAQPPGGGRGGRGGMGGGMGGGIMLLNTEAVQKELKITDDQKEKLKAFADEQGPKMRDKMQELRQENQGGGDPAAGFAKMQEAMVKLNGEAMTALTDAKILKDDQLKRFKQIEYQSRLRQGPGALTNDDIAKALKLTDDQKEKVKTLAADLRKDTGELRQDLQGGGEAAAEARKKMQSLNKEYTAKATDLLTSDQKASWKDMTGTPFEFPAQQQGRGGAGGQGGRGGRGGNNPPPPPPV